MSHLPSKEKKRLAVFKFASCDGCQLSLLSCEDELLALTDKLEIAHFLEASSRTLPGPFDLTLVEGSVSTNEDVDRIHEIRRQSRVLVTIGACATAGGIQSLRNWADHEEYLQYVYPHPEYLDSLATSTAISDHVPVEFELRGCPIDKHQLLEVILAFLNERRPNIPSHSVCLDCKRRGTICIAVTEDQPCLGPITQAGCGAICPAYHRACYGCFGPCAQANTASLSDQYLNQGTTAMQMVHQLRNMNAGARLFQIESDRIENNPSSN
ncbi:NADH ubiquinone oxidoreductase 20 kDa subunit [Rhodopirellula maiorica SM1]|uniref:NADH ubiquinone oxidoreductase 20 kDa subunit n=1 Tax=Rhodopirellula maiorica SM1 TaxID=1265738 RepID=M5RAW7_9BACT|nr:NADH ubiquinone dehydrogenase [Rhodopirellula maiorica]EMI16520.1 NADH ubiquinone oxidoreductase 20 kDa subunit [Rhodopirellula maiorica SM1]